MEDYPSSDDHYDYRDDDDVDGLDSDCEWTSVKGPSSQVITKESLLTAQLEDLQRVMDLLSLKEHHARTILIHYSWDVDKVFAVFVEKGQDRLYAEAGVKMVEQHKDISSPNCSSEIMCDICMEKVPANETTTMECSHCYCNDCWTEHFVVKINEGQSRRITCMAYKCNVICDEGKIRNLVGERDSDLAKKFDRFLLESYIEDNRRVKWCPSVPHCGNAIRVEDDKYCEVECVCGVQFCFSCSSEAHSPCSCLMWKKWVRKCSDESETVNWIKVHTKPCPKCQKLVEKNGGCNLVRCVCGQPFCWLCGGATGHDHNWSSIAGHSCGRFSEAQLKKFANARNDLVRYIHYHNRYKAHVDSYNAEVQMKEKIQAKVSNLEAMQQTWTDFSWVTNALSRLFRSRKVILLSYPFAYYMFGDELFTNEMTKKERQIKQNLFEDQQQQFEANVEKLSMLLAEPFDYYVEDKLAESRMKIMSQSNIIDDFCKKLYECIEHELLGPLQQSSHIIAPYRSNGVEKASRLPEKDSAVNDAFYHMHIK